MQESYLPTKFPRGSSRSRGPVSAPTARLISCAGSGIWRPAGSRLGKAAPGPSPPAAPGWRRWSCLSLAFLLQTGSLRKAKEAERSWQDYGKGKGPRGSESRWTREVSK